MSDYSLLESAQGASILRREGERNHVVAGGISNEEAAELLEHLNRGDGISVGDLFEWITACAFVAAAYIQFRSLPLALTVGGVCLAYFAQCYSSHRVHLPRLSIHLPHVKFRIPKLHIIKGIKGLGKSKSPA